jgi:outer membrane lipoprotein-sorting protein
MSVKHPNAHIPVSAPGTPGLTNRPFPLKRVIATLLLIAAAVAASAVFLPRSAHAKDAMGMDDQDTAKVKRLEDYLNAISTLSSRFMQVTDQGQFAQGEFLMARPGKMRIDYDPPMPVLIVSNGTLVMYKDEELDQFSYIPLSQVPASMFIGAKVDFFNDELLITNFEDEAGVQRLTLQRSDDPAEGSLTLMFEAKPLQLRKWSVIDAQGITTTVSLLGPKFGATLSDDLFKVENKVNNQRDK